MKKINIIFLTLYFLFTASYLSADEGKTLLHAFHVVKYNSDEKLRLIAPPQYIGKINIFKDYSTSSECIKEMTWDCGHIEEEISFSVKAGVPEFAYNTLAKTAEEFPVRVSYCKHLQFACCKQGDKCFDEVFLKELFRPSSITSYRAIENDVGEKYLKNQWGKEQKKDDLVNATILIPNDKIMRSYILFKRLIKELPFTKEQKAIYEKEKETTIIM